MTTPTTNDVPSLTDTSRGAETEGTKHADRDPRCSDISRHLVVGLNPTYDWLNDDQLTTNEQTYLEQKL